MKTGVNSNSSLLLQCFQFEAIHSIFFQSKLFCAQESLKKPLTWKPHKGPLKKYEDSAAKPSLKERSRAMKEVKITSRFVMLLSLTAVEQLIPLIVDEKWE